MQDKTLEARLGKLRKIYASRYARVEALKLKTANRDEALIQKKKNELADIKNQINSLENALREK